MNSNEENKVIPAPKSKPLYWSLWGAQVLLAIVFGMAGTLKTTSEWDVLVKMLPWAVDVHPYLVRSIGLVEFIGAAGVLIPGLSRVLPQLIPYAGLGLGTVMILAAGFHGSRGEYPGIAVNLVLAALAFFVFWGRKKEPIHMKW